jgi:hypothetical protein
MSSEQGPHAWGCERPRVLPASYTLHLIYSYHGKEEAA